MPGEKYNNIGFIMMCFKVELTKLEIDKTKIEKKTATLENSEKLKKLYIFGLQQKKTKWERL